MRTTTTFVAPFGFVGLDCLFIRVGCLPFSLYTFPPETAGLARDYQFKGFPEFDRIYLPVTHVSSPITLKHI